MSQTNNIYYSVEPYTGDIICHYRTEGAKNGYHYGKLVDPNKVAKQARVDGLNNKINRLQDSYRRTHRFGDLELRILPSKYDDPISNKKILNSKTNSEFVKNIRNDNASFIRNSERKAAVVRKINGVALKKLRELNRKK